MGLKAKRAHKSLLIFKDNLFEEQKNKPLHHKESRYGRRHKWVNIEILDELLTSKKEYTEGKLRK